MVARRLGASWAARCSAARAPAARAGAPGAGRLGLGHANFARVAQALEGTKFSACCWGLRRASRRRQVSGNGLGRNARLPARGAGCVEGLGLGLGHRGCVPAAPDSAPRARVGRRGRAERRGWRGEAWGPGLGAHSVWSGCPRVTPGARGSRPRGLLTVRRIGAWLGPGPQETELC